MNAVLKYPGSKWRLADWVIRFFPPHHTYLEPFFGSGAVLFNKPRSDIETVNDLDGNVVNLFEWIKRDPERLAHERNVRHGKRKSGKAPERPANNRTEIAIDRPNRKTECCADRPTAAALRAPACFVPASSRVKYGLTNHCPVPGRAVLSSRPQIRRRGAVLSFRV